MSLGHALTALSLALALGATPTTAQTRLSTEAPAVRETFGVSTERRNGENRRADPSLRAGGSNHSHYPGQRERRVAC